MTTRTLRTLAATAALVTSVQLLAQVNHKSPWSARTPWGDPDLQGEWTTEGEYGVPLERPLQFGTRQFLTDAEYSKRLADVRTRDERDLARVDVLSGNVEGANAPIPHWREYNTTSRRTSLIIDPPDGRLPSRTAQARPVPVQRCGSLQRGEPCDTYEDYGLGVRCIVHGSGFPDAMFPAVYNANMRIMQGRRLVERFTRTGPDSIDYRVTFNDSATWTAPWTAALDMRRRPDDAGVFEYACHEGNYGLEHMLRTSRLFDR